MIVQAGYYIPVVYQARPLFVGRPLPTVSIIAIQRVDSVGKGRREKRGLACTTENMMIRFPHFYVH